MPYVLLTAQYRYLQINNLILIFLQFQDVSKQLSFISKEINFSSSSLYLLPRPVLFSVICTHCFQEITYYHLLFEIKAFKLKIKQLLKMFFTGNVLIQQLSESTVFEGQRSFDQLMIVVIIRGSYFTSVVLQQLHYQMLSLKYVSQLPFMYTDHSSWIMFRTLVFCKFEQKYCF